VEQTTINAISQLGFPIVVAIFLVYFVTNQLSKKIDGLTNRIEKNTETVAFLAVTLAKSHGLDPDELRKYVSGE
jgi:hypothetical protein